MQVDQPWVEVFRLSHSQVTPDVGRPGVEVFILLSYSQVTPDVDRPAKGRGIHIIELQSSHT